MESQNVESAVGLGTWLGRRQAFAVVAGRCSAADVECLRTIREEKLYLALEHSWEEFCRKHAGISRSTADLLIRQLEQLGVAYFHLASVTRITPEIFRLIAPAVNEEGVQCGEERIPFAAQNAAKLGAAVEELRARAEAQRKPAVKHKQNFGRRLRRTEKSLAAVLAVLESMGVEEMSLLERQSLRAAIDKGLRALQRLTLVVPQ